MGAALIREIGNAATQAAAATTVLPVVAGVDIPAGSTVAVAWATQNASSRSVLSIVDSKGNTYTLEYNVASGSNFGLGRSHITTALQPGDTITITWSGVTATRVATAVAFSGLDTTLGMDRTAATVSISTTPNSGPTATTSHTHELLIGAIGVQHDAELPSANPLTAGTDWTIAGSAATEGVSNNRAVYIEYRVVSAVGAYAATGTLPTSSKQWRALIATYAATGVTARPRS